MPAHAAPHWDAPAPDAASVPARPAHTHSPAARRVGYVAGALVDALIILLINVWPGWQSLSFLTADAATVVSLVNLGLVVGIVMNLVWIVADPPWLRTLGDALSAGIGLAVLMRALRLFPFTFADADWAAAVRLGLVALIVVTGIALVVCVVKLIAEVVTHESTRPA